jgi:hypothetical protein
MAVQNSYKEKKDIPLLLLSLHDLHREPLNPDDNFDDSR